MLTLLLLICLHCPVNKFSEAAKIAAEQTNKAECLPRYDYSKNKFYNMKKCDNCGKKLINAVEKALMQCAVCESKHCYQVVTPTTTMLQEAISDLATPEVAVRSSQLE